jgi:hypothetical protein
VSLLSCEEITDAGVEALAHCPDLRTLNLPEFAAISDNALVALSTDATKLESLRLDHLKEISDRGLASLASLRRLRNLTIQSCSRITADAVGFLQHALPGCQVNFKA